MSAIPPEDRDARLQDVVQTTERRLQAAGIDDVTTQLVGADRVRVTVPAGSDLAYLAYLTTERGQLDFREQMTLPDGTSAWVVAQVRAADGEERALTSEYFTQATPSAEPSTNRPLVLFEFNPEGRQMLAALTQRLMGQRLGIFVDGQLYMALTVRDPIVEGRGQITGQFTPDDARNLAIRLNTGALPVPLQLVEAATS
jgi:preprotein translocase subunit SecD